MIITGPGLRFRILWLQRSNRGLRAYLVQQHTDGKVDIVAGSSDLYVNPKLKR